MDYDSKAKIIRLSQLAGFLFLGLTFIIFFYSFATSGGSNENFAAGFLLFFVFFGMVFILFLISIGSYFFLFTGEERRRYLMERTGKIKDGQLIENTGADNSFDIMPDENIIFASTPCFSHIGNAFGFRENAGNATVTNKRIHIKYSAGESNCWRKEVLVIPKRNLIQIGYITTDYTIQTISYQEEKEGEKVTGFLDLGLGENGMVLSEIKIYHPRSKEICDIFSNQSK